MHNAGVLAKHVSPYRSELHSRVRTGLSEQLLLPALHDEAKLNVGAETPGDLIRGVRDTLIRPDFLQGEVRYPKSVETCMQFTLFRTRYAWFFLAMLWMLRGFMARLILFSFDAVSSFLLLFPPSRRVLYAPTTSRPSRSGGP